MDAYEQARERVKAKKGFYGHLAAFLATGAFFLFLNISSGGGPWFFYPMLAWGIGLVNHAIHVFSTAAEERRGFYHHLGSFVMVGLLLMMTNIASGGGPWFLYPMMGWGIGLAAHASKVFFGGNRWEERQIDREMRRLEEKPKKEDQLELRELDREEQRKKQPEKLYREDDLV